MAGQVQLKEAYLSPANPFTILEPEDQGIGEFYVVQERRVTDFKAR